jgi:hypothetical protein
MDRAASARAAFANIASDRVAHRHRVWIRRGWHSLEGKVAFIGSVVPTHDPRLHCGTCRDALSGSPSSHWRGDVLIHPNAAATFCFRHSSLPFFGCSSYFFLTAATLCPPSGLTNDRVAWLNKSDLGCPSDSCHDIVPVWLWLRGVEVFINQQMNAAQALRTAAIRELVTAFWVEQGIVGHGSYPSDKRSATRASFGRTSAISSGSRNCRRRWCIFGRWINGRSRCTFA